MYKSIGITGGIASGKSTVSHYLKDKGYVVLDADIYARNVLNKGTEGLKKIVEHFGNGILNDDGTLNREVLGHIVFNDKDERAVLNSITHPIIRQEMNDDKNKNLKTGHVFSDIPLLYENKLEDQFDIVIVVYVDEDTQLKRLMTRNDFTEEEARRRIASQLSLEEKKKRADIVFNNNDTKEALYNQIDDFIKQLND
ncbi:dephospho-CoA kinase [Nosocomiicoccus massiliensis]|uniref:Dephospho-CoA kinase n=1 Tax=Nosocomiicoccus massiliensis TaxID=1232430 RepID=A0AAF1BN76_9STAP|nr:dephospho-CoA kinase [Nosocomiicoccus massiliensis]WOS96649.1 dephospho-CoA kinase [Nosocomiicoccus massiliensis]